MKDKFYYKDGTTSEIRNYTKVLHRTDGPAIEEAYGDKYWFIDGKLHRTDGPAVEWADGTKYWYVDGECHRADGPAVESASGSKRWYVDGERCSRKQFKALMREVENLSDVLRLTDPREWVRRVG